MKTVKTPFGYSIKVGQIGRGVGFKPTSAYIKNLEINKDEEANS